MGQIGHHLEHFRLLVLTDLGEEKQRDMLPRYFDQLVTNDSIPTALIDRRPKKGNKMSY